MAATKTNHRFVKNAARFDLKWAILGVKYAVDAINSSSIDNGNGKWYDYLDINGVKSSILVRGETDNQT
jgi:hypothetical protein